MSHPDIFNKFSHMFPDKSVDIVIWFPNGRNSIRVRNSWNEEFIFTFNNSKDWMLETANSFLNRKEIKR